MFSTDALTEYATVNLKTVNVPPSSAHLPPHVVPLCRGDSISRIHTVANNRSLLPSDALTDAHTSFRSGTIHRKCQPPKDLSARGQPQGQTALRSTCQIQNDAYALAGGRWAEEDRQPQQQGLGVRVHEDDDKDFSVIEFPRENLRFLEKVGEGQFGEVRTAL